MTEQVPIQAAVLLGDDRDRLGVRQPKLDWQITEADEHSTIRMRVILMNSVVPGWDGCALLCIVALICPVSTRPPSHGNDTHADNPKKGVVDRDCRVHGTSNLFIAGPSVFPTGGYAGLSSQPWPLR